MIRSKIACLLLAVAVCGTGQARAATFCVTTSAQLQASLDLAEVNDDGDQVRIAIGHYYTPPGGFVYDAESIANGDQQSINISGGWEADSGNPCAGIPREDPSRTTIETLTDGRVMELRVRRFTHVSVSLLSFIGGQTTDSGGGLKVWHENSDHHLGDVTIRQNYFYQNKATIGGGLSARGGKGILRVFNNFFVYNHASANAGAAYLARDDGVGIFVISNTAWGNQYDSGSDGNDGIVVYHPNHVLIANNNMWNPYSDGANLNVYGGGWYGLLHNNFERRFGPEPDIASGNLSFDPGNSGWIPAWDSPLVDAGIEPGNPSYWWLTEFDLKGRPRIHGTTVDIGAYEYDERVFADGFE